MSESGTGAYKKHNRNKKRNNGGAERYDNGADAGYNGGGRDSGRQQPKPFAAKSGAPAGKPPKTNPNTKAYAPAGGPGKGSAAGGPRGAQNNSSDRGSPNNRGASKKGRNNGRGGPLDSWRDFDRGRGRPRPDDKDRLKWVPPALLREPIPMPSCPICGKVISEPACAVTDKLTGEAAHFDCVREKLAANEAAGPGEELTYIGGGRFGIVSFEGADKRRFQIKKIIEYEAADKRADWRGNIADHYSLT
jgi:hypothetical protein